MASVPASSGNSGGWAPALPTARTSSQTAPQMTTSSRTTNPNRTVNSVPSTSAPRPRPTPIAAGRFRPAPRRRRWDSTDSVATRPPPPVAAVRPAPCPAARDAVPPPSCPPARGSDLEQLGFLVLDHLVDRRHVPVGCLVELLPRPPDLVLAGLAVPRHLVQRVLGVPADVADGDLGLLALVPGHLAELAPALLGQLREHHPDDHAVVGGVEAEVAVPDRLLDRAELVGVVRLDDRHPGLGHRDRRHL